MPTSNPRDTDTILDEMDTTTRLVDPGIDTRKGPLSVMYYAHAVELSKTESLSGYLQQVWQLEQADSLEDEDIYQLGLNYGLDANVGSFSKVVVHLFRYSKPADDETIIAEAGTQIGTRDQRFVYTTLEDAEMPGNIANVFYNAEEQRYEIAVNAEAIAVGLDYDLPPTAIDTIITPVEGFDGVINKTAARGGGDTVDKTQFVRIVQDRLQGISSDVTGFLISTIQDIDPGGFDAVSITNSSEFDIFKRLKTINAKMGYDIYLITDKVAPYLQTYVSAGGETYVKPERTPILAVQSVVVDGTPVSFNVELDTRADTRGSPLANDRITLSNPLLPAQTVEIRYMYYDQVWTSYNLVKDRSRPFGSDVLVRVADPISVRVEGRIKAFSTADRADVVNALQIFTEGYFRNPTSPSSGFRTFVSELDPYSYQKAAEQSIDGLQEFQLTGFARLDFAFLDVEVISFDGRTEYPILHPDFGVR